MNEKKIKNMSIAMSPEMQDLLKESAKKAGYSSVSYLIRILVEKYLNLVVNDGEEIPIILRVPSHYRGDKEALEKWFQVKTNAIVNKLSEDTDD